MDSLAEISAVDVVHRLQTAPPEDNVPVQSFRVIKSNRDALQEQPCIAYLSSLLELAPAVMCTTCNKQCQIMNRRVGSAFIFIWVCTFAAWPGKSTFLHILGIYNFAQTDMSVLSYYRLIQSTKIEISIRISVK